MKPTDNLNNLSQVPCGSALNSTTENSSTSSDSDMEMLSTGVGDPSRVIQGLKRTIRRKQNQINELTGKLIISDIHLASEKEKTKDKEDVIQSLKISIDVITKVNDLIIKTLQSQLIESQTSLGLTKNEAVTEETSGQNTKQTECAEINVYSLNADNDALKLELSELNDKTKKFECSLKEKDEHIAILEAQAKQDSAKINEMHDKLSKFTLKVETSQDNVLLNSTKNPSTEFVILPRTGVFVAAFEDLPSAGPGWMVIQRRIDGKLPFESNNVCDLGCFDGFGYPSREFWLGCDKIHELTTRERHELYIELVDFDDAKAFARYDHFVVGGQSEHYKLKSLGEYSGNAGDSLRKCENNQFLALKHCPEKYVDFFGWWIGTECNLNGKYYDCKTSLDSDNGIWWGLCNLGKRHSLKSCKMLIRPNPLLNDISI